MREKLNFVIKGNDEETARKRAMEWYSHKKNLTVDSVKPYSKGGYVVYISYNKEDTK